MFNLFQNYFWKNQINSTEILDLKFMLLIFLLKFDFNGIISLFHLVKYDKILTNLLRGIYNRSLICQKF